MDRNFDVVTDYRGEGEEAYVAGLRQADNPYRDRTDRDGQIARREWDHGFTYLACRTEPAILIG